MLFTVFLLLTTINLCSSQYNIDLVYNALNISQSAYCMGKYDTWSCATCSVTNNYETKLEKKK